MGITINGQIVDTMIAASLIDENRFRFDLNSLSWDYLGHGKNETSLNEEAKSRGLDPKADMKEHLGAFIFQHNDHQIIFSSDGRELSGKQTDNYWKRYMEGESTFSLYVDLAKKLKLQ